MQLKSSLAWTKSRDVFVLINTIFPARWIISHYKCIPLPIFSFRRYCSPLSIFSLQHFLELVRLLTMDDIESESEVDRISRVVLITMFCTSSWNRHNSPSGHVQLSKNSTRRAELDRRGPTGWSFDGGAQRQHDLGRTSHQQWSGVPLNRRPGGLARSEVRCWFPRCVDGPDTVQLIKMECIAVPTTKAKCWLQVGRTPTR